MGLVSPLGLDTRSSLDAAYRGDNGIARCDDRLWGELGASIACRVAGTVKGLDPVAVVGPTFAERYDPALVYAIQAAREAFGDAGYEPGFAGERFGVVVGTAVTGAVTWERHLHTAFAGGRAHEIPGHAVIAASGSMPSGLIALEHGLRGPSAGIVSGCASGAAAIAAAADQIRLGRADAMLAGGTEAGISLFIFASFVNGRGMNPTSDPHRASRPFSRDRSGFVKGEGCGLLVLEDLDHARDRGAQIYGLLLGSSSTNDAYHVISPDPTGERWARAMRLALDEARVHPDEVDWVSAHAASTQQGDAAETRALRQALGARARDVPVTATKSMHGHAFGATGAIETILALGAMCEDRVIPTINLTVPDPECDLDYVAEGAREASTRVLLKNSLGFGGMNTCLVLRRPETCKTVSRT